MKYALDLWSQPNFRNLLGEGLLRGFGPNNSTFTPAVDVQESADSYTISVDLPGIKKDGIEIEVKDRRLVVSGKRNLEKSVDQDGIHVQERVYGSFERSFYLPEGVDTNKIEAVHEDGVLALKIAKSPESKATKIKVN